MLTTYSDKDTYTNNQEVDFLSRKILDLNKMLVESEKAKTRFLSLIANELNNPMTAILGLLPHFAPNPGDTQEETFELLLEEALVLDFRIQNLVAAAELESGVASIAQALINPAELFNEAIKAFRFPIKAKKVKLHLDNALNAPIVSDPLKLYLIIKNILANAVCYGNMEGSIDINLYEDGSNVFMVIKDEGKGPDVKFKPEVFTRFAYGPSGNHGLGIGLSIVRELCELMDGSVDYTVIDNYVTFTVKIPLQIKLPNSQAYGSNEFLFDSFDDAIEL